MTIYVDDADLEGLWWVDNDLTDESANGNDLTDNGTVGYDGVDFKQGTYSLDLDSGIPEYGSITDGNQTGLECTSDFSLGAWVKDDAGGTDHHNVMGKLTVPGASQDGYRLGIRNDDFRFYIDANAYATTDNPIPDGQWVHVVITHDGTNLRCYVDGSENSSGDYPAATGNFPTDVASDFNLGAINGGDYPWDGHIDEAFVFSRALSADEVEDIYLYGIQSARTPCPPAAYNTLAIY